MLYPNDSTDYGKELRLKQQVFFVSASIQDVLARYKVRAVHLGVTVWRRRVWSLPLPMQPVPAGLLSAL